jgi:hypothetical protein
MLISQKNNSFNVNFNIQNLDVRNILLEREREREREREYCHKLLNNSALCARNIYVESCSNWIGTAFCAYRPD